MSTVKKDNLSLFFLVGVSLLFSLIKISQGYTFEWDQSDDASKVMYMIHQKKPLLIGPRVSNDNGFFVGPYHYYFLLPFYFLTQGDPLAGAYAVAFVNILTTIVSFLLIRRIFGYKTAFFFSLLNSIFVQKICWNAMYAPLISIISFYLCYQIINNKKINFPLSMLFAGFIANIHLVPISLTPIIIFSFFISNKKPKIKEICLGILFFCLPFLPLIIFDLRHQFLNIHKLWSMIFDRQNNFTYDKFLWLKTFWNSLNIFGFTSDKFGKLFSLIILIISPFLFKNKKNTLLILIWILFPLIVLSQYHGSISEYYYSLITSLVPLFLIISIFKLKNIFLRSAIILVLLFFSIKSNIVNNKPLISLNDKKAVVKYLVEQQQDQPFNLSYETGIGMDFGFDYLFNYYGNPPKNIPQAHLYTLFIDQTLPKDLNVVFKKSVYSLVRR